MIQTAAVVVNERGYVLLLEDPETGITGLPRSHVPHCLDTHFKAPLAFLSQTGFMVSPLPIRTPTRLEKLPEDLVDARSDQLHLAFAEQASTTPFSIALDLAYFDSSNLPRLADARQSIVFWYAGIVRGRLPDITPLQRRLARFLPLREAVAEIQAQPMYDCVAVCALRLFQKILEGTGVALQDQPMILKPVPENQQFARYVPHEMDAQCYPASMMPDPIFPPTTPNTTEMVRYAFWSAADYIVRTGAVVLNEAQDRVLLGPGLLPNAPLTLPRCTRDNVSELLYKPLGKLALNCSRLPLPRLSKSYSYVPGQDEPEAETVLEPDITTTDPFFLSFRTWWDHKTRTLRGSLGRQEITFWYAASFDDARPLPPGYVALPVAQALDLFRESDAYAWTALQLCLDVLTESKLPPLT